MFEPQECMYKTLKFQIANKSTSKMARIQRLTHAGVECKFSVAQFQRCVQLNSPDCCLPGCQVFEGVLDKHYLILHLTHTRQMCCSMIVHTVDRGQETCAVCTLQHRVVMGLSWISSVQHAPSAWSTAWTVSKVRNVGQL